MIAVLILMGAALSLLILGFPKKQKAAAPKKTQPKPHYRYDPVNGHKQPTDWVYTDCNFPKKGGGTETRYYAHNRKTGETIMGFGKWEDSEYATIL